MKTFRRKKCIQPVASILCSKSGKNALIEIENVTYGFNILPQLMTYYRVTKRILKKWFMISKSSVDEGQEPMRRSAESMRKFLFYIQNKLFNSNGLFLSDRIA